MQLNKSRLSKLAGLLTEGHHETTEEVDNATSEDALFDKDPADDPEATSASGDLSADLTAGYSLGPYGIAQMESLQIAVLQEMKLMEEGMFDFLKPRGGRWKDATGMSHPDMGGGPGHDSHDMSAHDLAVALVNVMEDPNRGTIWSGGILRGSSEKDDKKNWLQISGVGSFNHFLQAALDSLGIPDPSGQFVQATLDSWESDGIITREEPEVFWMRGLGRPGPNPGAVWLKWSGFERLKRLRDKSGQVGRTQYSY